MVTHSYYPEDPRVKREAGVLVDQGYSVDIICLREIGEKRYEIISVKGRIPLPAGKGITVYRLPVKRHRGGGFFIYLFEYLAFFCLAFRKTAVLFFQKRYKIVQVHTIPDFLVFCSLIPKLFRSSVFLDMHEVMPEFFIDRYNLSANQLVIKILKFIEKISTKFADKIITVSDTLKEILINRGVAERKITVIMNVPDTHIFKTPDTVCRIQPTGFTLAYHGLLSDIYDLTGAIKSVKVLKEKIPGLKFLIIGSGPKENEYKQLVRELKLEQAVIFKGQILQEKVPEVLGGVDLGVVPLKNTELTQLAFPTKVVEYIVLGIPVVTADRRTIKRYFNQQSLAFYNPVDENDLTGVIYALYQDPQKMKNLAENALKCYDAISWEKMKERYYKLIEQ